MISEDSRNKNLTDKTLETPETEPSITNVHFSGRGAYRYVSGDRKPIAIRIDTGLYSVFKPLAKRVYGSVCRAVEIYITTLIEAVENGVHFSNTEQPIRIEKIVIERNLRPRRNLEFSDGLAEGERCLYCHKLSVDRLRSLKDGRVYPVCGFHVQELLSSGNWSVLENE